MAEQLMVKELIEKLKGVSPFLPVCLDEDAKPCVDVEIGFIEEQMDETVVWIGTDVQDGSPAIQAVLLTD